MDVTKLKPAFEDERGSIWDLLTDEEIHHVGFLISKKNSIRGKHYHKEQTQYTIVLNGTLKIITKNLLDSTSTIEEHILHEMDMIVFPPFCYHSLESSEDSKCMVLTSKGRGGEDYEKDTIRVNDIQNYVLPS